MTVLDPMERSCLYHRDFVAWADEQARLVRSGRVDDLDLEHLAEEIEAMGGSQRTEVGSRLAVILEHLLKWEFQPDKRKYGWRATLIEQRISVEGLIDASPSLQRQPEIALPRAYALARVRAAADTGLPERTFPAECPYGLEQVFDPAFYPGREEREIL